MILHSAHERWSADPFQKERASRVPPMRHARADRNSRNSRIRPRRRAPRLASYRHACACQPCRSCRHDSATERQQLYCGSTRQRLLEFQRPAVARTSAQSPGPSTWRLLAASFLTLTSAVWGCKSELIEGTHTGAPRISGHLWPKTVRRRLVVCAAGFLRIFCSSCANI